MERRKLTFLYGFLGLCTHKHETWPMRLSGEAVACRTCLGCGRRRPYLLLEPSGSSSSRPVRVFGRRSSDLPDQPSLAAHQVPAPRRQMGWLAVES